jgi:hypothetical protein
MMEAVQEGPLVLDHVGGVLSQGQDLGGQRRRGRPLPGEAYL